MRMQNTCGGAKVFDVTLKKTDKQNMAYWYNKGQMETKFHDCRDHDYPGYEICSFIVGEIEDYEAKGYQSSSQTLQGMRFSAGAIG